MTKQDQRDRVAVYEHLIGYLEETLQEGDEIFILGYLDEHQWLDAIKTIDKSIVGHVRYWVTKVNTKYGTKFLEDWAF